jgi:hypothetical protein
MLLCWQANDATPLSAAASVCLPCSGLLGPCVAARSMQQLLPAAWSLGLVLAHEPGMWSHV